MSSLAEILKRKAERKKKLQQSLESLINQLKSLGALKIILFGSLARDEIDINSDLDVFVLMPSNKNGKEWMDIIYEKLEMGVAADIIAYNLEEFKKKLSLSSFLGNIINSGRILYEKT